MALPSKLFGLPISLITGLITSTTMWFAGLALNLWLPADFAVRWLRAAATSYRDRADAGDRHSADPALRHAAGRIAGALRSGRTKKKTRRKPAHQFVF